MVLIAELTAVGFYMIFYFTVKHLVNVWVQPWGPLEDEPDW